mmetsp:Transcript_86513/g.225748  ORF Transcript_86513/g.225748 Transcript_86513/m.225748 type:complete len:233 (-) Transcript_86513:306-1004(-)
MSLLSLKLQCSLQVLEPLLDLLPLPLELLLRRVPLFRDPVLPTLPLLVHFDLQNQPLFESFLLQVPPLFRGLLLGEGDLRLQLGNAAVGLGLRKVPPLQFLLHQHEPPAQLQELRALLAQQALNMREVLAVKPTLSLSLGGSCGLAPGGGLGGLEPGAGEPVPSRLGGLSALITAQLHSHPLLCLQRPSLPTSGNLPALPCTPGLRPRLRQHCIELRIEELPRRRLPPSGRS